MAKITYVEREFRPATLELVRRVEDVLEAFDFPLTLRQLYYRMVDRGLLKNRHREYKRLSQVVHDAQLAGVLDWQAVGPAWIEPEPSARVEVWSEKNLGLPSFACRGQTLGDARRAAVRLEQYARRAVLVLVDLDRLGEATFRDVAGRLQTFGVTCDVRRIALGQAQALRWKLPPNPSNSGWWELDAIDPRKLRRIVRTAMARYA